MGGGGGGNGPQRRAVCALTKSSRFEAHVFVARNSAASFSAAVLPTASNVWMPQSSSRQLRGGRWGNKQPVGLARKRRAAEGQTNEARCHGLVVPALKERT